MNVLSKPPVHTGPRRLLRWLSLPVVIAYCSSSLLSAGCGWLADKDRVIIAEIDGKSIRRGDLKRIIREMTDEERPLIQNKGDLIRVLQKSLDDRVKTALADELRSQNKLEVPRDLARAFYFSKNPEFAQVHLVVDPSVMGLTEQDLVALKASVEFGVDDEEERLYREGAVNYRVREAVLAGAMTVSDDEFELEYSLRKEELRTLETLEFVAITFPAMDPEAASQAAEIKRRIVSGEPFSAIVAEFEAKSPSQVMRTGFQNDPSATKFQNFWFSAENSQRGDVLGPVFLPAFQLQSPTQSIDKPESFLLLEVLDHIPERMKTLEEAKVNLAPEILFRKMMKLLREEHGVKVFEDKLWNPAGYGNQFKDSFIRTN